MPGTYPFYSAKEKGTVMDLKDFIQAAVSQIAVIAVESSDADGSARLRVAGSGADLQAKGEQVTRLQFSLPIAMPQTRSRRPMATTLDSEFLQTVENDDSTWLPAR